MAAETIRGGERNLRDCLHYIVEGTKAPRGEVTHQLKEVLLRAKRGKILLWNPVHFVSILSIQTNVHQSPSGEDGLGNYGVILAPSPQPQLPNPMHLP